MPVYVYQCETCREFVEEVRAIRDRNREGPACSCGAGRMVRALSMERVNSDCQDWAKAVHSHRMAVSPDQVPAHRKAFPDIPMTDTGEIIVRNGAEERRINRALAGAFKRE